ncbi:hypothetical protein MIND_00723600 [Mycena indigotica]|uniref:CP-type G domain-containing protein n=1 Tax=Mycena indigotica TaxID=2126181 RepID=A0A8H6SLG0_9AGAR|nr:uncharacterized protein MIND_00723600 [Mycena indigotica]KAF7301581.1 hypothetical protein MIND_00723600 [Mycena indigotica]
MPRIRKKTSNRTKTNDRRKVQNKVRESRKKKAKAAKNNTQWKSKHKKDPGIPSAFPYKEQILAEIADQRREAAEEKQRRRDEKAKKRQGEHEHQDEDSVLAEVKARGLDQGFEGISSLSAKQLNETKVQQRRKGTVPMEVDDDDEEDTPILINRELPNLQAVLDSADVVIQILDARDPLAFRSEHLEELAGEKHVLFVLNKIETCPRESVSGWLTHLRASHPTVAFRSATGLLPETVKSDDKGKGKAKASYSDALGADAILDILGAWAEAKKGDTPLCVAVVGVTNVGKTSFVNSLLQKATLPIYTLATSSRGPTTTAYAQEVSLTIKSRTIRLIDTPGLTWEQTEENDPEQIRARDILLRSKGRIDRLKDPVLPVHHLIPRANAEDLMLFYTLPAFTTGDTDAFLSCVARANQLVKKVDRFGSIPFLFLTFPQKGDLDLTGAARIGDNQTLSAADEAVLATLQTRKELRKSGGLVKLTTEAVETRRAIVDESWVNESGSADESSGDEANEPTESEESGDDEDEESEPVDEDEQDDEDPEPVVSGKQKRKRAAELKPAPRKKVSFGPDPKSSKKARLASGAKMPVKTKAAPLKKVANAPVKTKGSQKDAGGPEAYSFKDFF